MKEKVKLKKLVNIIADLIKLEGNEWLTEELLEVIGNSSSIENISKQALIQNIHEYCIEKKIEKQAFDFYSNFPIISIRSQLIDDYKKMEHERRRDEFENFSLSVYQQIENITNYLFENEIIMLWPKERSNFIVKSYYDSQLRKYVLPTGGGITLEKLIFEKTNPNTWYANRKFRAVLYYFYFNKNIVKDTYQFNGVYFTHKEIYQMRNQNHRGGTPSSYQQRAIENIKGNEARYYFKFYGFLQDFVTKVESALE